MMGKMKKMKDNNNTTEKNLLSPEEFTPKEITSEEEYFIAEKGQEEISGDDKLTSALKEYVKMDDLINPFGYIVKSPKWKCAINCGGGFAKQ